MDKFGQSSVGHSILVTGAGGFVGAGLCESLLADGVEVKACVREIPFIPGGEAVTKLTYVAVPDISIVKDWSTMLQGVDVVVHLAARAHVLCETELFPIDKYRAVNTDATLRLAYQASMIGIRRFVFISSIGVNGNATFEESFNEEMLPSPHNDYAISKWEAEQSLAEISKKTGMEIVIVRPPLVYGPAVKANFLRLLKLIDLGVPLPLGSVDNRRSFVSLANLVDFLLKCIAEPTAAGKTFMVADGEDVSTPELIRRVAGFMGRPARLVPVPETLLRFGGKVLGKSVEINRLCESLQIDIGKAGRLLGWQPPFTVDEGLDRMVAWYIAQKK